MDRQGAKTGVHRSPLVVEAWPAGLRVGSLAFLVGVGGLMKGEGQDNPLRVEDQELVPMVRPQWDLPSFNTRLPVAAFVAATNANRTVPDYLGTGE